MNEKRDHGIVSVNPSLGECSLLFHCSSCSLECIYNESNRLFVRNNKIHDHLTLLLFQGRRNSAGIQAKQLL